MTNSLKHSDAKEIFISINIKQNEINPTQIKLFSLFGISLSGPKIKETFDCFLILYPKPSSTLIVYLKEEFTLHLA